MISITIKIKHVYGKENIYPACETALKFAQLTGKKTFSRADLSIIKSLGYAIEIQAQEL